MNVEIKRSGPILSKWEYKRVEDGQVIARCFVHTYYEAASYFEDLDLVEDPMYKIEPV